MKKTYQNPTLKVVNVKLQHMIAASVDMVGRNASGAALSRDGGDDIDWEDEQ